MQRILVVEDDFDIQELLQNFLQEAGYEVAVANDGVEALSLFAGQRYDLIILDILLPKIDGYGVCELIRKQSDVPIIMLTALSGEEDQIRGLDLQVDDYITKPFSVTEVLARIKANIRRSTQYAMGTSMEQPVITQGVLSMNLNDYSVKKNGKEIELTAKEFEILKLLLQNPKKVYTKEQIYSLVWNDAYFGVENAVNVHISRLRTKIEDNPRDTKNIITVWGIGNKLGDFKE